jgi:CDP-glycerol glycerophosphotransferase
MREAGLERFDRIAFINEDRRQRYLRAGLVSPEQAVLVGYPKADALVNGHWSRTAVRQALGLDIARPTVIYAPTFSTANSLHLAGMDIVAALLEADVNVVVKLHDRSMTPDPRYTAGIDWPGRFSTFRHDRRFVLATGADIEPYLAASDVLVTDHSTVGFEFALIDRPIVVYDAPALLEAARIEPGKWELLRSMAAIVHTPSEMVSAVQAALADPSHMTVERRRARHLFARPGTATQRALEIVYELLDMQAPQLEARRVDASSLSPAAGVRS